MKQEVKIEKLDYYANGITHVNDKITFVPSTLPEEEVLIQVEKENKTFNEASVLEYKKASNIRIENPCKYKNCGGCNLLHVCYKDELEYKQKKIKELFKNYRVNKIIPSPKEFNYRNKITLKVIDGKLGLFERNSHNIVNINKCLLVNENINNIIEELNNYNLKNVEEIVIKDNMVVIKSNKDYEIFKNLNVDNVIIINGSKEIILKGNNYIIQTIGNLQYYTSVNSFFQVNSYNTKNLYDEIIELANFKKNEIILDLYCGVGSIGLYIASYVKKVIGIEINYDSILDANKNMKLNKIKNVECLCLNVNKANVSFMFDTVIIDPPRSGLDTKTINILKHLKSNKIIYVSCNPITLKRDIKALEESYEVLDITPVDMFPKTYHIETITLMSRILKK